MVREEEDREWRMIRLSKSVKIEALPTTGGNLDYTIFSNKNTR